MDGSKTAALQRATIATAATNPALRKGNLPPLWGWARKRGSEKPKRHPGGQSSDSQICTVVPPRVDRPARKHDPRRESCAQAHGHQEDPGGPGPTRYLAQAHNDYDCKAWQEQPELLGKQRDQNQARRNTAPRRQ